MSSLPEMTTRAYKKRELKACIPCAKLKIRCDFDGWEKCKRCTRLRKDCERQSPGAHSSNSRATNNVSSRADILRLESKVDSVSQLLSTAATSLQVTLPPSPNPTPLPVPVPHAESENDLPNDQEAIFLLSYYQAEMAAMFPFVVVPYHTTLYQLKNDKLILYMSIMMIACQNDSRRQLRIARIIRQEISQTVLVRGEKNLGVLQGVLVYIAWNHMHLQLGHHLITLTHLATSIVTELGFEREPNTYAKTTVGAFREAEMQTLGQKSRTIEERRALLGVFWMCSTIKTCFKDVQALRFSRYADHCCKVLCTAKEHPNDVFLVELVRTQQKAQRIGDVLYGEETVPEMTAPLMMSISSFEQELTATGAPPVSSYIPQDPLLRMAQQMLLVYLYKIALEDRHFPPDSSFADFRNKLLFSCVSAIDALLNIFFELPTTTVLALPYPWFGMMGHSLVLLSRLAEVKHGTWNAAVMAHVLDPQQAYGRMVDKFSEIMVDGSRQTPPRRLPDVFDHMMTKFKSMANPKGTLEETIYIETGDTISGDDLMNDMLWDFLDWT